MIKRFYVPTSKLEEGMQIDQVIKDRLDRTLIARGSALDAYLIHLHLSSPMADNRQLTKITFIFKQG